MRRTTTFALLLATAAALALVAAGCGGGGSSSGGSGGGGGGGGSLQALPSSSCSPIEYKGQGDPDVLIATDLPLQGSSRTQTLQIVGAIRYLLQQQGWKAGSTKVAFQSCDDATSQAAKWDPGKCSQNANAYAGDSDLVAVIGTFNSGCAAIEIPVLNRAPGGGLGMVSPANTYVCLTEGGPGCEKTEPKKYYPTGKRNYARVVAHDAFQGAADAEFLKSQGVKSVYVLNDKEAYGLGVATNFKNAASHLGLKIAGFNQWDAQASNYQALMNKIKATGADAVFLGGLIDENGAQLIKDKVAVLGPNNGKVKLLAPDGFTTQQTIDEAGKAAADMYMSVAGVPIDQFKGTALQFIDGFKKTLGGKPVDPYAIYGAQAGEVVLNAIKNSDASRQGVISEIFKYKVNNGLLGTFSINQNGDPEGASGAVVGFTMYRATTKLVTQTTISPKPADVDAARG